MYQALGCKSGQNSREEESKSNVRTRKHKFQKQNEGGGHKVSKKLDTRKAETDGRVWIPSKMFRQTPSHLEGGILSQPSAPGKKLVFV